MILELRDVVLSGLCFLSFALQIENLSKIRVIQLSDFINALVAFPPSILAMHANQFIDFNDIPFSAYELFLEYGIYFLMFLY